MKYFNAFTNIPKPKPPNKPVMNLNVLLLSLYSKNWVNPSIADGINNKIANTIKYML